MNRPPQQYHALRLTENRVRLSSSGFSLVELLLVVACIALLCALLFPALQNANQSAKKVACLKSLQQLYVAARCFANDHQNSIPWTNTDGSNYIFWCSRLSEYAGGGKFDENTGEMDPNMDTNTITCPASPYANGKGLRPAIVQYANYGMNDGLTAYEVTGSNGISYSRKIGKSPTPLLRPHRFSDFRDASTTVMYFDSGSYTIYQAAAKTPVPAWSYIPGYEKNAGKTFYPVNNAVNLDAQNGRHGKIINYVRLDGSLGSAPVKQFVEDAKYWKVTPN